MRLTLLPGNVTNVTTVTSPRKKVTTSGAPKSGTSISNAATDTGCEDRGLEGRQEGIWREFGESTRLAEESEARYPEHGRRFFERLSKSLFSSLNSEDEVISDFRF
jgi:hypothetical protein